MKIEDARVRYNVQIKTYYSKQRELYAQKQKLEEKIKTTENGAEVYKDESAILELQYSAVDEKRQEYQDYMDKLMEQWRMISDKIASKQQSDAMADQAKEMNKIMLVARRIMHGDKVPAKDEKKLMEYCAGRDITLDQCYTFKTDRHHLIFMSVQEEQDDGEKPYAYIMYIDIGPITRYIVTLNWAFFAVLLAISSVMCLLGFRFGRDIEKEAERQQTFFQNASHELKTPLMAIQGYAEGIQAGVMDTGSAAEVILAESDRMTELVEELLDISKIDMGRQRLTLSETDIRELLYDGIRAVEPIAAGGIAIVPDFPEEPVMVSCDDTRLRRAVTNILSNGVRYARSELRLTCRADKRHVTIRIQDDGDGIAEEDLPHIFDRFYMGKSGKSGIGLALTREIIHLHKGTIRARNGDTGAVFEISIPVSR